MSESATNTPHAHEDADPVHLHTHHVTSWQLLTGILIALLVLTALTVVTAEYVHLPGSGNVILALFIAFVKASLVCAFFMHLLHDKKFNSVILFYCLLAIACFLMFTTIDLGSRRALDPMKDGLITPPTVATEAHQKYIQEHGYDPRAEDGHGDGGHGASASEQHAEPAAEGKH